MSPLDPAAVPCRRLEARARKYRGKLFVANAAQAFQLDEVAEFIFRQIDGTASMREIGEKVAVRYGSPLDDAIADAADLVEQLVQRHVLEVVADPVQGSRT